MSLTEITQALDWSKPTAFRFCRALQELGMLDRDAHGAFSLGPMTLDLGTAYLAANPTRSLAAQVAEDLSRTTGATVLICLLIKSELVVVVTAEGTATIKVAAQLGERLPIYATAGGKAIAASLAEDEMEDLIGTLTFDSFSPRTINSARTFRDELKKVQKDGYSLALEEYRMGVFSVAVALAPSLFARPSALVAVLPSMLAPREDRDELIAALNSARAQLDPLSDRESTLR